MKRMFLCMWVLLLMSVIAQSQSKTNRSSKHHSKNNPATSTVKKNVSHSFNTATLNSTSSYPAKTGLSAGALTSNYFISDPIIRALDARANGATINIPKSGIVGMPKRAYGFANGHLTLKTTGAITSGTQTGSGAVATGTSLGTFGSSGPAMEVNGKSPYAGTIMWGNALNMYLPKLDTTVRLNSAKRQ